MERSNNRVKISNVCMYSGGIFRQVIHEQDTDGRINEVIVAYPLEELDDLHKALIAHYPPTDKTPRIISDEEATYLAGFTVPSLRGRNAPELGE